MGIWNSKQRIFEERFGIEYLFFIDINPRR